MKALRDAGAVIIAKTSMTELANWIAGPPTPMPGGYNAITGFGMNPYDPRRDPRDATFDGRPVPLVGGSSSGIGTSANFWAANVGTETSGSLSFPPIWPCWSRLNPPWGASAATALSRSLPTRIPRGRLRGPSPMLPFSSVCSRIPSRIRGSG